MENKSIIWKAQDFKSHEKSTPWYIAFVIIFLALIAYGIYTHNFLTLVTFVVLATVAFVLSHQKPQEITYELSATSIKMSQTVYPYRNIKKFWIVYTPENKTINFETTAYLNNQFSLQLGRQDPLAVKEFLKNYLQEDLEKEESISDIISRKIKF